MVTNQDLNTGFLDTFQRLVKNDRVLRQRLEQPYPLGLPIFQTYKELTPQMMEIFRRNEWCGEVSRVIVDREFRGSGIAHRLLEEVLRRGDDQRIRRVFLECLRTHEKLYQSHGFNRIEGLERPPVDVNRTMIAMQRTQAG
jgi:predicted GNAT family N-acyltransferase